MTVVTLASALVFAVTPTERVSLSGCEPTLVSVVNDELAVAGFDLESSGTSLVVTCSGERVQVELFSDRDGRHDTTELVLGTGERAQVRLAVQVVDLLHASLAAERFRGLLLPPPSVVVPPDPEAPSEAGTGWVGAVQAGAAIDPRGVGAEPLLSANVARRWARWEIGVGLSSTVHGALLEGSSGAARFGLATGTLQVQHVWTFGSWTLAPRLGLGALVGWAFGERPTPAYLATAGAVPTFVASAAVSGWYQLVPAIGLGVSVEVFAAPFPVRVQIPGAEALMGLPTVALLAGARFR